MNASTLGELVVASCIKGCQLLEAVLRRRLCPRERLASRSWSDMGEYWRLESESNRR